MPRTKANIPVNETPTARFIRLANIRVNAALTCLRGVGALSGTNYQSTPEQRKKIEETLKDSLIKAMISMNSKDGVSGEFKL